MISAREYVSQKKALISEYEDTVRMWLKSNGKIDPEAADKIPFLADGAAAPERWFSPGNDFRPLFILKEASIGINNLSELDSFLMKWGGATRFEHVEDCFGDIKIGVNKFEGRNPWIRVAMLAKGMETYFAEGRIPDYEELRIFQFKEGGKKNPDNVSNDPNYACQTANKEYLDIIDRIAVVNMKKLAGGTNAGSNMSIASGWYLDHISNENPELETLFIRQILMLDPTVIICCGIENKKCISEYLPDAIKEKYADRIISCPHPTRSSTQEFYYDALDRYAEILSD